MGAGSESAYWDKRRQMLYYKAIFQVVSVVGKEARSIIDIGSAETDYVSWFGWIGEKAQLNLGFTGQLPGVERISTDFLSWEDERTFDVALCLQVLEHVPDPAAFCDRLQRTARRLVISVPYKWGGNAPGHIHDPVDESKLQGWMGRKPNYSMIVREPFGPARLIAYYDIERGPGAPGFGLEAVKAAKAAHAHFYPG